jgi:hypothetical protein
MFFLGGSRWRLETRTYFSRKPHLSPDGCLIRITGAETPPSLDHPYWVKLGAQPYLVLSPP